MKNIRKHIIISRRQSEWHLLSRNNEIIAAAEKKENNDDKKDEGEKCQKDLR